MVTYETIIVTAPVLTEDDERVLVDGFAQIVTDGGGTFFARDRMGRRRLAYPIRKFDDGVYTRFLYDSEAAVPRELERRVRLSDKVLRWLTVKLEKTWAEDAKKEAEREAQAKIEAEARAAEEAARAEAEGTSEEGAGSEAASGDGPPSEDQAATSAPVEAAAPAEAPASGDAPAEEAPAEEASGEDTPAEEATPDVKKESNDG